jgi:hypothetical protein
MSRLLCLCLLAAAGNATAATPVFDMHVHLHDGATSLQAYQAAAEAAGLELTGLGAMWFGGSDQARQGQPEAIRAGNDSVIALAATDSRLVPIATVHPYDGQAALDELARVADAGVRVLKLHPHTQRFDAADPRVEALVRRAGELGITVMFDNANIVPGDSEKLFNLVAAVPSTRFVLAHAGGMNFRFWNVLPMTRTAESFGMANLYFDISATVLLVAGSPLAEEFAWTLRNVGIDRVLLGSDYPQLGLGPTAEALERLPLSDDEKAAIRYRNARALFGR